MRGRVGGRGINNGGGGVGVDGVRITLTEFHWVGTWRRSYCR